MIVLSFDIGIKNLAFAIVQKIDNQIKLLNYDILNINNSPLCQCKKNAKYQLNDIYYCDKHKEKKSTKIKNITAENLCTNLINKLNQQNFNYQNINYVVIENQPSLINPTMKSIQIMVLTFFALKNIKIILQHPKFKTHGHTIEGDKKDKYKKTKQLGIKLGKELIDEETYNNICKKYKKIDDIIDATLHGIYFLNNI